MSSVFILKTGKAPGLKSFPVTFGLIADVGQTTNSSWTLQQLGAHEHDVSLKRTFICNCVLILCYVDKVVLLLTVDWKLCVGNDCRCAT